MIHNSALLEPTTNVEERIQKKMIEIIKNLNSIKNPKGMTTYFKNENRESIKKKV